jgi:hypothetical protein
MSAIRAGLTGHRRILPDFLISAHLGLPELSSLPRLGVLSGDLSYDATNVYESDTRGPVRYERMARRQLWDALSVATVSEAMRGVSRAPRPRGSHISAGRKTATKSSCPISIPR